MKALVTASQIDYHAAAASPCANRGHDDLASIAAIWWGENKFAGFSRRKEDRRFVLAVTVLIIAITSIASVAAEPDVVPGASNLATADEPVSAPIDASPAAVPSPVDHAVEMTVRLAAGQSLDALLLKAGAAPDDARRAARLVREASSRGAGGSLSIFLGDRNGDGSRRIEQIAMRPSLDQQITVTRAKSGVLELRSREVAVDGTPVRIVGTVGSAPFWSLRAAGATPEIAEDYLTAMAARGVTAFSGDRFELVADRRRATTGEIEQGALQYAGLYRARRGDVRLLLWMVDGRRAWVDPDQPRVSAASVSLPLGGRISSPFGIRTHPIFRTAHLHRGIDIRAAWGTPVHAPADGQVTRAGWSGGYGLRIRLAHRDGLATTYSHLSRIAVTIGTPVRQGELIGYVGSTGFSTGAHLHYELFRDDRPVNPLSAQVIDRVALSRLDRAALTARLDQLRSIPAARAITRAS